MMSLQPLVLAVLMFLLLLVQTSFCVSEDKIKLTPPVIDVSALFMVDPPQEVLTQLHHAIRAAVFKWGFFSIINHNVNTQLDEEIFAEMKTFFQSPDEVKNSVRRTVSNSRGFTDSEYTKQQMDMKQIFDVGHKPFPHLADNATENIVLDGYNQYPVTQSNFRRVFELYYEECVKLAAVLLRAILKSIDLPLDDEYFHRILTNHTSFLRLNYYPVVSMISNVNTSLGTSEPAFFGVSRHTDAGILTILRQDSVAGLEVYSGTKQDIGDGVWCPVDPVPGALTINIGDMFQVLTNGNVSAPEHRVRASQVEGQARYSAPFFYNPAYDTQIAPLIHQQHKDETPLYHAINWGHFRRQRFAGDYSDVGREIQIEDFLITEDETHEERDL